MAGKPSTSDDGDKIILPPSSFDILAQMNIEYPMLFEIENTDTKKVSHCGVLEFTADEGTCYLPFWMMENMQLQEQCIVKVTNKSLPKAKYLKLRPQSTNFLNVTNPRAVLEYALRKFTCMTIGDIIPIKFADEIHMLEVCELKPSRAVSIVETDCVVDFDRPVGYIEPVRPVANAPVEKAAPSEPRVAQKARNEETSEPVKSVFVPFSGSGVRIDGRPTPSTSTKASPSQPTPVAVTNSPSGKLAASTSSSTIPAGRRLGENPNAAANNTSTTNNNSSSVLSQTASTPAAPANGTAAYVPKIGDKYSKLKSSTSAFGGTANRLS